MSQDTSVKSPLTSAFRPELKTGVFRITLKSDSKISDDLNPSPKLNPDDSVLAPPGKTYGISINKWEDHLGLSAAAGHIGGPIKTTSLADDTFEITLLHSPLFRASLSKQTYLAEVIEAVPYSDNENNTNVKFGLNLNPA